LAGGRDSQSSSRQISDHPRSQVDFAFDRGLVLKAIIASEAAHQRTVSPILQDPVHVFPGEAGHSREFALRDLLAYPDAPVTEVITERFSKAEQDARDAALLGKKARCSQGEVGLTQAVRWIGRKHRQVTQIVSCIVRVRTENVWNPPVTGDAEPNAPLPSPEATRSEGGIAYCVRLCDGRYFPIQRHSGANSAQNAFAYREKIIPGCTCNGSDAVGLVNTLVADDPTLRPGDIVATNAGLMAYNSGPNGSTFTPISTYAGLSADLRRQLTETKIEPAAEGPTPPPVRQAEAPPARTTANKRAQADR
jgi:Protein of unknown function (DUF2865)